MGWDVSSFGDYIRLVMVEENRRTDGSARIISIVACECCLGQYDYRTGRAASTLAARPVSNLTNGCGRSRNRCNDLCHRNHFAVAYLADECRRDDLMFDAVELLATPRRHVAGGQLPAEFPQRVPDLRRIQGARLLYRLEDADGHVVGFL